MFKKNYNADTIKSSLCGENGKFLETDYNWIYVLMYWLILCVLILIAGGERVDIKSLAIKVENKFNLSSFIYISQKISHKPFYQR